MKKDEVGIGNTYAVKVSGKISPVTLVRTHFSGGWMGKNEETGREIRIRTAAKLREEVLKTLDGKWMTASRVRFEAIMDRQPKSPAELDEKPFLCVRCGDPMSPGAEGFISKGGFPVHIKCQKHPTELQEYKDANNGTGWKLNRVRFSAWYQEIPVTSPSHPNSTAEPMPHSLALDKGGR